MKDDWPHAPVHRLTPEGVFMVTAATLHKHKCFVGTERLNLLHSSLLALAKQYLWQLEAWAVFPNHYHFIGRRVPDSGSLATFLRHLHSITARELNGQDGVTGRKVWFNYWETHLTFEKSYFARLNYVHRNAVKHKLVAVANQYPWCSAAWFERTAPLAVVKTIYGFDTERVTVVDEFD
ncbi:MAG: hypothetical protein ABI882_23360 [Acidobacteriota bacterium]